MGILIQPRDHVGCRIATRLFTPKHDGLRQHCKLPPLPPVLALVHPPHKSPCHLPKMCSIQASKCSHSTPTTPFTQCGRQPRLQAVMPALRATPGRPPAFRPDAPHRQNVACKTLSDTKPRGGREGDGGGSGGVAVLRAHGAGGPSCSGALPRRRRTGCKTAACCCWGRLPLSHSSACGAARRDGDRVKATAQCGTRRWRQGLGHGHCCWDPR